jgi:hypothetical protein
MDYLAEDEASDEIVTEFRSSSNGEEEDEEEEGVEWCSSSLGYRIRPQHSGSGLSSEAQVGRTIASCN